MNLGAAFPLLLQSAKLGHPKAQAAVAHAYSQGMKGVPQDYHQAAHWYGLAAAQGDRSAQFNLAGMYTQGLGGKPVDLRKAAELLTASARQNYAPAQQALGICYEFGEGVKRDRRTAIVWLDRAAAQGDQVAAKLVTWLKKPRTPAFHDEAQLGNYIAAQTQQSAPRSARSATPGHKDSTVHPVCGPNVAPGTLCQGYGGGTMYNPH